MPLAQGHHIVEDDLLPDRALTASDSDAFSHTAIADRVAEIVTHSVTPANIALFGAWGSGKSSLFELLRRSLHKQGDRIALVHYDAWKYGGAALKRNFISHSASALGLTDERAANRDFHRGLYESTRSLDLRFGQLLRGEIGGIVRGGVVAFGLVLLVSGLAAAAIALAEGAEGRAILWTVATMVGAWGFPAATFMGMLVGTLKLVDIAKVEVERSVPSADELFSRTFTRMIAEARERGSPKGFERLVFFIDELDRCSRSDVVETLTALRTFLDVERCIFIVVADRDVLEEALYELPQSTPANDYSPYYSTASAFLDKIFQYQISLPPLRVGRLTRYARDLVRERGGLWEELQAAGTITLNDVIYALIPSHVRSPRRIKVLLNRFATNCRIAQARGLDWRARASEIAKLTVLQTEFPLLADALPQAPKLPDLILARDEDAALPRATQELVDRFVGLTSPRGADEVESRETGAPEVGRLLVRDEKSLRIHQAQLRQLIRYLERTARVQNPGRDLLFLESAGRWAGLEPSLGQLLEDLAPEAPEKALSSIKAASVGDQQAGVALLAELAEREFGVERANVVAVALKLANAMDHDVQPVAHHLAASLETFLEDQELEEDLLDSALRVAVLAGSNSLVETLMEDERLLEQPERVEAVSRELKALSPEHRKKVAARVGEEIVHDPSILLDPLMILPEDLGLWLLKEVEEKFLELLRDYEAQGDIKTAVDLADPIPFWGGSSAGLGGLIWRLLSGGSQVGYQLAKNHASRIEAMKVQTRNSYALAAAIQGPAGDWSTWLPMIAPADQPWDQQAARAEKLLLRLVQDVLTIEEEHHLTALELARRVAPITTANEKEIAATLKGGLASTFGSRKWWVGRSDLAEQTLLHRLAEVISSGGTRLQAAISTAQEEDIARGFLVATESVPRALKGVRILSQHVSSPTRLSLLERLGNAGLADRSEDLRTRLHLWAMLEPQERTKAPLLGTEEVIEGLGRFSEERLDVLGLWLATDPPLEEAAAVATATPLAATRRVAAVYGEWGEQRTTSQRTRFLCRLWEEGETNEAWVRQLRRWEIDELVLLEHLMEELKEATRADEREDIVDRVVALEPVEGRTQYRVGDLVVGLLQTGRKGDFQLALRAMVALRDGHRSKGRIETALKEASESLGVHITPSQARTLRRAGITPPKRSFTERAWAFFVGEQQ